MPKSKKVHIATVTAEGVMFPPSFTAAVLAMQRYRAKRPDAKPGEVQFTLDYGEKPVDAN